MFTPGFRPVAPWLALVYSKANLSLKQIIREAKMEAGDIEHYLAELGAELKKRAYAPLRESVQVIKQKHDLDADWLNYLAQMLMYDEVIVPDGKLWKRFGPLHVYAPASEYILALKITAGRQKDLDDCAILLPKTKIRTRKQTQQVLDRYILPGGQQKNAESIENALNRLFGREG